MCKVCDMLNKQSEMSAMARRIARDAIDRLPREQVEAEAVQYAKDEKYDVSDSAAEDIYTQGVIVGVTHTAAMMAGAVEFQLNSLKGFIRDLFAMRQKYANTPSVIADLAPMIAIARAYAERDIQQARIILAQVAAAHGVRASLATNEEGMDHVLDEEYALIGERLVTSGPDVLKKLMETLMGITNKRQEHLAGLGKEAVLKARSETTKLDAAAVDYLNGDATAFDSFISTLGHA